VSALPGEPSAPAAPPLSAVDAAALVAALVDVLIPGAEGWPPASAVGVQGLFAVRFLEEWGEAEFARLTDAVLKAGGPFDELDEAGRVAVVERFQANERDLFDRVLVAVTLAYYESPIVAEAVRQRTGRPYSLRPHATGYPMTPFDETKDTPRHGRGAWLRTDQVKPVDIAGLELDTRRTETWGIKR
jgi:hypothetical protein